jgi:hypothetical protein
MSSVAFARVARARLFTLRTRLPVQKQVITAGAAAGFATSSRKLSADPHAEESFEEFTARYDFPTTIAERKVNGWEKRRRRMRRESMATRTWRIRSKGTR